MFPRIPAVFVAALPSALFNRRSHKNDFANMLNDSTIEVTRALELRISGAAGQCVVQLDRISAQHLAAAMREFSGAPSRGVQLNAGKFRFIPATSVDGPRIKRSPVRLGSPRGGVARL
jgi:hypothetical protein